ncbi:AI-2E family transporter [Paraburkholderia lycopersici]|uniref:Predicted PurR-regulated permease PerM n=1 Tax=Paraburkholderia lycopersici TaxID=416944 RepID=A0A1G6M7I8_9BURK|nr:AI-2E family transporter [Paraburkholderia lycopersici]SDC51538.1 Predicted PurR-regulated permease PerM [Paraburkholderia lycopersici]
MNFPLPPQGRRNRVFPPSPPTLHSLASVITGVVVVCGLYFGRAVLIPITLSVLLSFLLAPLVTALRRFHVPQFLAILVAVLSTVLALAGVGALIAAQIYQLSASLPQYQEEIEQKVQTVQQKTVGRADSLMSRAATALQRVTPTPPPAPLQPRGRAARNQPQQPTPVEVHTPAPTPLQLAQRALAPVVAPLETGFIVLVVTIFILFQREDLRDRLISVFGSDDLHRTTTAINDASQRLSRYFVAQLGVNVTVGAVIALGLAGIGVPGALLFGAVAALMRFVPYIGIWIAAIMATIIAAATQPQWTMAVSTLIFFIVVDVVAGQFAEPMLYGRRSGLSPLAVVVAAIFWSWLWGPVGLVLSTPLTLCIVTLGRYVDRLNFLTILLGDQPALTPAQTCYQRLLADDPHEALLQADRLLTTMPLIDYYEQVVFEGLRFARNDALRGVLPAEQVARINQALLDIVEDLESVDDSRHAAAGDDSATKAAERADEGAKVVEFTLSPDAGEVLCVPGRGAFDDVAAAIVGQLLMRHDIPCTATTYEQVRATRAAMVDGQRSPAICVVSLDAPESAPYLRNLVRRLRERAPDATIVVGIGAVQRDDGAGIADDPGTLFPTSLRNLVEECGAALVPAHMPQAEKREAAPDMQDQYRAGAKL